MGGKSRKTGGISKALIDRIKSGQKLPESEKKSDAGKKTNPAPVIKKKGFDFDEE